MEVEESNFYTEKGETNLIAFYKNLHILIKLLRKRILHFGGFDKV